MLERLERLRGDGWMVAAHNDYTHGGESFTFWLLTRGREEFVKGEGRTDAEALERIRGELVERAAALPNQERLEALAQMVEDTTQIHRHDGSEVAGILRELIP